MAETRLRFIRSGWGTGHDGRDDPDQSRDARWSGPTELSLNILPELR
jgi:hypothetical protein